MLNVLFAAVAVGLMAAVYRTVLPYEEITAWWWRFGNRFEHRFFFKPIWGCEKCISGQIALWGYIAYSLLSIFGPAGAEIPPFWLYHGYLVASAAFWLFGLFLCVLGAIFFSMLFTWAIKWLESSTKKLNQ